MKTRMRNVMLEATLILMLTASVGLADLSDGLVAYYPFNGNANDESGNGHNGTLEGDATVVWDAGGNRKGAGNVLQLDGEGDYAIVDASRAPRMRPACTISGWLKIPSTYQFPRTGVGFVNKMLHSTGMYLYDFAIGHDGPCLAGIGDGTGAPGQETTGKYVYWSDSQEERRAIETYLFDNTWHHLAYTWDPDQLVLYVDGVFQNSISHNVNVYVNDPMNWDLNIGRRPYAWPSNWIYLEASIDEVRIYNRALSADEVEQLAFGDFKVDIDIDIKSGSCPNPLNIKDQGMLPVAVLGSEDFDVFNIDPASIRLEGVAPIRSSYEDVATPGSNETDDCDCTTEGQDGYLDLVLNFDAQEIIAALGGVYDGDVCLLTLTGEDINSVPIEGIDCVVIIAKNRN